MIYLWCSAGDSGPYQAPKTVYLEIDNIRRGYLEDFIKKSNSSLIEEINNSTLEELLLAEEVADETDTELDIRNIGVLMFAEHPEKFIPGSYIELIRFNTKKQRHPMILLKNLYRSYLETGSGCIRLH